MTGALVAWLAGGRLHLQHGPIDIVMRLEGAADAVAAGERAAAARFATVLAELVAELPALRRPDPGPLAGAVARRMAAAVAPHRPVFVTPMAAVAGAVAEAVLAAAVAVAGDGLARGWANNGGDIALHLAPGAALGVAIAARPGMPDRLTIAHADPVRGIATSGRGGRSFSLGIADAVTVLAASAPAADAAATLIANAVDLPGHPGIRRRPAAELQEDSDLGPIPVTVAVAPLAPAERARALARGRAAAAAMARRGLIAAAALFLQGEVATLGPAALMPPSPERLDA
ncbi:MAG: UPF0280 family protein [Rhodobacteraceae bacterium]|jgi:ApbE superfamily uncharacterized protein (UPF0280 family)|nr:UPF0280 family protein [Paracoccaceae bacterium]